MVIVGQAQSLSTSRSVNRRRTGTIICRNSRHSGAISLSIVYGSTVPLRVRSCRKAPVDSRGRRIGARWRCRRAVDVIFDVADLQGR